IGVRVVAEDAGVAGDDARGAEHVFGVELRGAARREQGHALAAEEHVLVRIVADAIGFDEDLAARAVPVEFVGNRGVGGIGLGDAAAIAIVNVVHASGGLEVALGVPQVAVDAVVGGVAGEVVGKAREMIVVVRGLGEAALLRAAGVSRVRGGGDGQQIPPGIYAVDFCPAFGGGGGIRGSGLRRGDAVELIVGEGLRTLVVYIVGDAHDVAVVSGAQVEIVAKVHGVAAGGGSLELQRLETVVVGVGEHKAASKSGAHADFRRGERALWSITDTRHPPQVVSAPDITPFASNFNARETIVREGTGFVELGVQKEFSSMVDVSPLPHLLISDPDRGNTVRKWSGRIKLRLHYDSSRSVDIFPLPGLVITHPDCCEAINEIHRITELGLKKVFSALIDVAPSACTFVSYVDGSDAINHQTC